MSDPLLDKMDALLKKHQGATEAQPPAAAAPPAATAADAPPPLPDDAWLPVLTDVVAVGKPDTAASEPMPAVEAAPEPPRHRPHLPWIRRCWSNRSWVNSNPG